MDAVRRSIHLLQSQPRSISRSVVSEAEAALTIFIALRGASAI
jgi:hypothetical protein